MTEVDPRALELLSQTILGHLGFTGLDGYPHVIAVWYEYRDGEILVASRPDEYKCRSLRADGRAAFTVSTPERPYWSTMVAGDASVERLPEARRMEFIGALARRYLGQEAGDPYFEKWSRGGHPGDGDLIRIRPRRIGFYSG